jgi:hypothetical protein
VIGEHPALLIGPVLADHHERRQEDRFQRNDHGEQPERVVLDLEKDPRGEPDDVDVDEHHRAGESRDRVGDAVLGILRPVLRVLDQSRMAWRRAPGDAHASSFAVRGPRAAGGGSSVRPGAAVRPSRSCHGQRGALQSLVE